MFQVFSAQSSAVIYRYSSRTSSYICASAGSYNHSNLIVQQRISAILKRIVNIPSFRRTKMKRFVILQWRFLGAGATDFYTRLVLKKKDVNED
jgi:hypothetical protein